MKLFLCFLLATLNFSIICNSQDIIFESNTLNGLNDVNSIALLDNGNVLTSAYQLLYVPFVTYNGDPVLKLSGPDGALIDSLSYPQLSDLNIVSQLDDGRVLGIGKRANSNRLFFVTIGDDLDDLKINKYLDRDANLTIEYVYETFAENDQFVVDAKVIYNQNEIRAKLTYDTTILEVIDVQVLPEEHGDYYFLPDDSFFRYIDIASGSKEKLELTKYDSNSNVLWKSIIDKLDLKAIHVKDDGSIYLAGREDRNDGNGGYEALLLGLDNNGEILNSLKIEGDPGPLSNPVKKQFSKILSYEDKLIVIGTNLYNADRSQGDHGIMIRIYDKDLNELAVSGGSVYGTWAWLIDCKLGGNMIYGIVNSGVFESSYSYEFRLEMFGPSSIASEETEEFSIYPNPTKDKINIDLPNENMVELYDINGMLLQSHNNTIELDVSHLPSGVYFVKYSSENGSRTQRIVKE